MKTKYPTKWQQGKPRGSDPIEQTKCYQVRFNPPGEPQKCVSFKFDNYGSKEAAYDAAIKWRQYESDKRGLTRDQIRYISKDVIEIKVKDKIVKASATDINKIQQYPLIIKNMRNTDYVYCQDKKKTFPLTNLICNYEITKYKDNNTMNLTQDNLSEFKNKAKKVSKTEVKNTKIDYESDLENDSKNDSESDLDIDELDKELEKELSGEKEESNDETNNDSKDQEKIDYGIDENGMKHCSGCNVKHPISEFVENKTKKSGYSYYKKSDEKKEETKTKFRLEQFQKAQKRATARGGKVISKSTDYMNAQTKLEIECQDGHVFTITLSNLNLKRWCPDCNINLGELITLNIFEYSFDKEFKKVRPDWLKYPNAGNLELDGYNNQLNLAFEYNGIQHYEYIKHFHRTKENFEKRKEYDEFKAKKCEENDVELIIIPYTVTNEKLPQYISKELIKRGFNKPAQLAKAFDVNKVKYDAGLKTRTEKIVEEKGGKIQICNFINRDSNITIICEDGHMWTTKVKHILYGAWCHTCGLTVKEETKDKIASGMKKFNKTTKGKKLKQQAHAKRSETMAKVREEVRATITEKECGTCKKVKPASEYHVKSAAKDGLQTNCKECINEIKRQRAQKKREEAEKQQATT